MADPTGQESLVVFTTLPDRERASGFVRRLVEGRLIACATILDGARSVYRWRGTVTEEQETLVVMKTGRARWDALVAAVEAVHPYDVPELLALPVDAGLPRYLDWIAAETAAPEEST